MTKHNALYVSAQMLSGMLSQNQFPVSPTIGQLLFRNDLQALFVYTGQGWSQMTFKQAPWFLFIDDERQPAAAGWHSGDVRIARSSRAAEELVERFGLPEQISFDHDLGGEDTAFKFMWTLINGHLDGKWDLASVAAVQIHSANPIGERKLTALWENFCRVHNIQTAVTRVWPGEAE